jgi:hypothetical protein
MTLMYRFKLIRRTPIYRLSRGFLERVESELHGLALKASDGAADLTIEHTVKDAEGEETFDTISTYPGAFTESVHTAEICISSDSANFAALFTLHKDNPFENMLVVTSAGTDARARCLGIQDALTRALSEFAQPDPGTPPKSEAKSFTMGVPSIEVSEKSLLDLERHLVSSAAAHTRLSPSAVANELRVTLKTGTKTEAFSSIAQRGDGAEFPVVFSSLELKLWSWNNEQKYNAELKFCANSPGGCNIEIDCEGDGARAAADGSRTWLGNWLEKCGNENYRWRISNRRRAFLLMAALYSAVGGLIALVEGWISTAVVLFGLTALTTVIMVYGNSVWPHVRLVSPKEEQRYSVVAGRFKAIAGSFLFITIIVPALLQIIQGAR